MGGDKHDDKRRLETPSPRNSERPHDDLDDRSSGRRGRSGTRRGSGERQRSLGRSQRMESRLAASKSRNSVSGRPSRSRDERVSSRRSRKRSRSAPRSIRASRSYSRRRVVGRRSRSDSRTKHDYVLKERIRLLENQILHERDLRKQSKCDRLSRKASTGVDRIGLRKSATRRSRSKIIDSRSEDEKSPERKKAKCSTKPDFFEEFVKIFKGRDRESFPVSNNVIPDFDPLCKEQNIDMWLNKVDECSEIYGWNDKQTVHYALPKLIGHAKSWYQGLPSIKHAWLEWKNLLRESFPSTENYAELLTDMLNRRARPGESLELYYYSKINLLNRCKIFGKQAVDCLIYGIEDKSVRLSAQAGKFEKPEDTLEFFKTVKVQARDNFDTRRESNFRDKRFPHTTTTTGSGVRKPGDNNNRNRTSIICFNCSEVGHPSFKCPKPLNKCSDCNFIGHNSANCPRKRNNTSGSNSTSTSANTGDIGGSQSKPKSVLEVSVDEVDNDKYKIIIKINNKDILCQVDMGSQATLVRESEACSLGLKWESINGPLLKGLGNIPYLPIGRAMGTVEVQGISEKHVEMFVVDDSLINTPVLLGHSFTERPSIKIIKTATDLQFERIDCNEEMKIILKAKDDVVVEVGKMKTISVRSENIISGNIYVGGSVRGHSGTEYYLLPGEYQIVNGVANLLVQNVGVNEVNFKSGTLITRARTIFRRPTLDVLRINIEQKEFESNKINYGNQLTIKEKQECQNLLSKFKDCFSSGLHDLGFTSATEMKIHLEDSTPVVYRPYRLSYSERQHVQGMVQEMLENGIVRESNSPYASPIVIVQKKTGEKRLCVDYRALNRLTKRDHYPLPRIEDLLDQLSGHTMFTTLDLASGYHQIAIAEDSKEKTAFVTPDGQYEYNRMPFGLANAPAVFQRAIHRILSKTKVPYVVVYMDDILIPSKTFEEGRQRLEEVFCLLREAGLTLKLEKCHFFQNRLSFLGFEVDGSGIRPGLQKTHAVSNFPRPRNQHEVRRFLGLAGFFRRFVKNFAQIACPLTSLLKKETAWQWSETQENAFESLRRALIERPLLTLYDHSAETQLHTDASKSGLGGILLQRKGSEPWKPVAYYSRQTSTDEQKLHAFELETLAVISALNKFRTYLLGVKFTIITDCSALRSTFSKRDLIPRISRWWIQFLEYNCTIEYRPGEKMAHVDALSRAAVSGENEPVHVLDILTVKVEDWISTVQSSDNEVRRIKDILQDPETSNIAAIFKEYQLKNGRVFRVIDNGELRWLVPRGVRWQLLKSNHDSVGHFGFEKTLQRIKSQFWFPKMRRFIKKYVLACLECAHHKIPSGAKEGTLHPIPKVDVPLHTLHADHLGPFPRSKHGNTYLLVIVDSFTKYVYLSAVRSTKTKASIKVFKTFFSLFGSPSRLITDRGTSFTSKRFRAFVHSVGVKHIMNSVATPRANGQVERYNRTILASLGSITHGARDDTWDTYLPDVQLGINTSVHDVTKRTPTELLFGHRVGNPSQGLLNSVSNEISAGKVKETIDEIRSEATRLIEKNQAKNKERFDRSRKAVTSYKEGDLVRVIRAIAGGTGKSKKLESKCQGPYRIKKILPNDRFLIVDTPITRKGKPYENVVSADKIFPWMSFNAPACSSSEDSDGSAAI